MIAFEPGRHDRLLVVDPATGRVTRTIVGPGSEGYAVGRDGEFAYLPVYERDCRMSIDRVSLAGVVSGERTYRKIAVVLGGPIDDVQAQPALSPDGKDLAVIVASRTSVDTGMNPGCGGTDSIAIVHLSTAAVRYVSGAAGDQFADLAWDGSKLLVQVTPVPYRNVSIVREVGPQTTALSGARRVLREPRGRYGPVFRWGYCLAVISAGGISCVRAGRVTAPASLGQSSGLPPRVERVSVAADGKDLLIQTSSGATYWWDGHTSQQVPVTVPGHWDEPTWG
jgi:hypothetical protein